MLKYMWVTIIVQWLHQRIWLGRPPSCWLKEGNVCPIFIDPYLTAIGLLVVLCPIMGTRADSKRFAAKEHNGTHSMYRS